MPNDAKEKLDISKVRMASHLLPDPGGEVVRDLLDRIEELEAEAIRSDEDAMVQADDAAEHIAELEADVKYLNQMIRDIVYGQGQIDAYVAQCEQVEKLEFIVARYARHDDECDQRDPCSCGLDTALKGLA